jgi:hypothetical protein
MKTRIKTSSLDINEEEYKTIKSDLENLIRTKPNNQIIETSEKMGWKIDQKEIIILYSQKNLSYRVEFYHNEKEGERKKCFLGSSVYDSPINL